MGMIFQKAGPALFASLALILCTVPAYAEHIIPTQYDIAELMMQKYQIEEEQRQFTVFYRFSMLEGHVEGGTEDHDARIESMGIDKDRTSLVIKVEDIRQTDLLSLRMPEDLISAEGDRFTLFIDGVQKGYELSKQEKATNMIMVLPQGSSTVEVVGTRVIPEFGAVAGLILAVSVLSIVAFCRAKTGKQYR